MCSFINGKKARRRNECIETLLRPNEWNTVRQPKYPKMPKTNKQEPQNIPKQPKQGQNRSNSTFNDKKHKLTTSPNISTSTSTATSPSTNSRDNINSPSSPK